MKLLMFGDGGAPRLGVGRDGAAERDGRRRRGGQRRGPALPATVSV